MRTEAEDTRYPLITSESPSVVCTIVSAPPAVIASKLKATFTLDHTLSKPTNWFLNAYAPTLSSYLPSVMTNTRSFVYSLPPVTISSITAIIAATEDADDAPTEPLFES